MHSFLLYLHTKGATHNNIGDRSKIIRKLWKHEFTKPRNNLYISYILNNKYDIVTPLSNNNITWYNGMYISKRAFELNNIFKSKKRFIYEFIFKNDKTRIKGIISENCKIPIKCLNSFIDEISKQKMFHKKLYRPFHIIKNMSFKKNKRFFILYLIIIISLITILKVFNKNSLKYKVNNKKIIKMIIVKEEKI